MDNKRPDWVCVDCYAFVLERVGSPWELPRSAWRPAPHGGPRSKRCTTHQREKVKREKARAHEQYVANTYGLEPGQYAALYDAQGGECALKCGAKGKSKRLAVDHDHKCCPGPVSCGKCVRGLLCSNCNKMLGHARDDPDFFGRAMNYLIIPPAPGVLRKGDDGV